MMDDFDARVTHDYADSDGVKIHYASIGAGPLIVFIHGFPDFWYTWREQMDALSVHCRCVAIDQRGYNLSDKPAGEENYAMRFLVGDVAAVIRHCGQERAIVVGHDWGGAVAWSLAMYAPALVEQLIILNLPHLRGLARELAHNPQQQANSQYARDFQQPGAEDRLTTGNLTGWVRDPVVKERYAEAMARSDKGAMLSYYRQNYPREPYVEDPSPVVKVQAPVLMIHGLNDQFLLPGALNGTWEWVERDLTITTIPHAGHFVQQDAPDLVTRTIRSWLTR